MVVGVSGSDNGSTAKVCKDDSDHDNDLLPNDVELQIGTDPCLPDTDGDTMTDGWEYYAAKDLNIKAVPYPGKRPFPNALDPSDGSSGSFSSIDFDGDGLTTKEEYRAWRVTGSSFIPSKGAGLDLQSPLGYSDGTKYSRSDEAPGVPQWRGPSYGLPAPTGFPGLYNFRTVDDSTGVWRDDERDADGDGLANWLESARGPGQNSWWSGFWSQEGIDVEAWPKELDAASADPLCGQEPGTSPSARSPSSTWPTATSTATRCSTARTTRTTTTTRTSRSSTSCSRTIPRTRGSAPGRGSRRSAPTRSTRSTRVRRTSSRVRARTTSPSARSSSERLAPAPS